MLVFNKEKCIVNLESHCSGYIPDLDDGWIEKCVGCIVIDGQIDGFDILPEWCNEVNITDFLTPDEIEYIMQDGCSFDDINNLTNDIDSLIDFLTPMYGHGTPECAEMTRRIEQCLH